MPVTAPTLTTEHADSYRVDKIKVDRTIEGEWIVTRYLTAGVSS